MLYSSLALLAAPALAQALKVPRDVQDAGVVRFPLETVERSTSSLARRQFNAPSTAYNSGYFYTLDVTIGTPGQTVKLHFDTGSSEMWVNPTCSTAGESEEELCKSFARFDPKKSDTFKNLGTPGSIEYGSGGVTFIYAEDDVSIGGAKLKGQRFGVATKSTESSTGLLGVGPSTDGFDENPYPFVLDNFFTQGFIKSRLFSMDLRGIESSRGSVIFGGIDTRKFSGPLEKRPILAPELTFDQAARYTIYLDGISTKKEDGTTVTALDKTNSLAVLMDSGYSISTLPAKYVQEIAKAFPSAKKESSGDTTWTVDCSEADRDGTIDFKFGKTVINVPYKDFIARNGDSCILGFEEAAMPVLGDTFLRAAYVVYDYDNRNVLLANNEDCGTNVIALGTNGANTASSLVGECDGSSLITSTAASTSTTSSATSSTSQQVTTTEQSSSTAESSTSGESTTTTEAEPSQSSTASGTPSNNESEPVSTSTASGTPSNTESEPAITSTTPVQSSAATSEASSSTTEDVSSETLPGSGESSTPAASSADVTSASEVPESTGSAVVSTVVVTATENVSDGATSTEAVTSVYTITSCRPDVTNCPVGSVTTVIKSETTPAQTTAAPPTLTSTITTSKVYTVTSCPPEVVSCPVGALTTEIVTSLTTYCPGSTPVTTKRPEPPISSSVTSTYLTTKTYVVTECVPRKPCTEVESTTVLTGTCVVDKDVSTKVDKTYTAYQTITCGKFVGGCEEGSVKTITELITPKVNTQVVATPTPGVPVVSTWAHGSNGTNVNHPPTVTSPPIVTGGASKAWNVPGVIGAIAGLVIAALL